MAKNEPSGLKYLYAGFSKCGTKSITAAFRRLGYKVYDFNEHQLYNTERWLQFIDPKKSRDEKIDLLHQMYKDVDVAVAMPIYSFWKELCEAFPDCKVIFYERPEAEWTKSSNGQLEKLAALKWLPDEISYPILRLFAPKTYQCQVWFDRLADINLGQEFYGWNSWWYGRFKPDSLLNTLKYRRHNADVMVNCPEERLLVLTVDTFNWETICAFVGKPIPTDDQGQPIEFPHVNKAGAFAKDAFKKADAPLVKLYKKEVRENTIKYLTGALLGYGLYRYRDHVIEGLKSSKLALNWK